VSMRIGAIALLSVVLIPTTGGEGPARGTIAVASRAVTPSRGQVIPPAGEVSSGGLRVKVDQRPPIPWPQRESLKIEGLDSEERHLLAVVDAHGKTVESLWFRFTNHNSLHLCMATKASDC
jgi:hypothetical protein